MVPCPGTLGTMRRLHGPLLALVLVTALSVPATSAAPLQPLVIGWEQFFKLTWTVSEHKGRPVVSGRIYNNWNFAAANVRLLVDELGADGQVVDQKIGWLGFTLTPGTTAPFEIPVARATPSHRVSVFAFDWVQADGGRRRF